MAYTPELSQRDSATLRRIARLEETLRYIVEWKPDGWMMEGCDLPEEDAYIDVKEPAICYSPSK